ncbi:MAG: radical SAM protein [bacterium]|nr:radical SAM protein [bacterium]
MAERVATIPIKEIYRSLQGESTFAGWPCTFVRTVGCDIRCSYCDEDQAFTGGERLSVAEIVERVTELGISLVEITGGEPLTQPDVPLLVESLLDIGHQVLVETGGHRDISLLDDRAHVIVDIKTPGSGMLERVDFSNLERLREGDELKFVLCDRADYEWARGLIRENDLDEKVPVHLSPVHGQMDPQDLVAWMLEDGLDAHLNLQLHKYIWGADRQGV